MLPSNSAPPLLELTLRADLDVLLGRWHYQPATAAELFPCYQQLAEMARATNCRFWLQDLRRRTSPDNQTKQWLLTEYYPEVAQGFGQPLFVAYLFTPAMHRLIEEAPDYAPPEAYFDKSYLLNFFGDEGLAIKWLQERQQVGMNQ